MKKPLKFKFTETAIAELEPPTNRDRYYAHDKSFSGFCLMVTRKHRKTKKFRKTYYLNCNIDGRSRRLRIGETQNITLKNALKKAKVLAGQVESGVDPMKAQQEKKKEMTLGDLMKEYIQRHAKPYKKTWKQDQRLYERMLSKWAKRQLSAITAGEIDRYHKKLGNEIGIYTANRVITLLKTMYNKAKKWKHFKGDNPTDETTMFREKGRERWITPEEMSHFMTSLDQFSDVDFKDYVLVSLFTGARQANIIAMKWEDLSLDGMIWVIPETKNGDSLTVDLVDEAQPLLQRRRASQDPSQEWVFPDPDLPSRHIRRPSFKWEKFLEMAGIQNLRMHDLRHTHASWLMETGADISDIQAAMGHKKIETALRYAHRKRGRTRAKRGLAVGEMLEAGKPLLESKVEVDDNDQGQAVTTGA